MGTRNKTHILKNGKYVIKQYGQWDGYPTQSTAMLIQSLSEEAIKKFIAALNKVEYVDEHFVDTIIDGIPEYYVGAKRSNMFDEVNKHLYDLKVKSDYTMSVKDEVDDLMKHFDNQFVADYLTMTRDTGYMIMEAVTALADYNVKIHIYLEDYLGFDVEAVNTIDLDKKVLTVNWHGIERSWNFESLPSEEELKPLEDEGYGNLEDDLHVIEEVAHA